MSTYEAILDAAEQLSAEDRLRLIETLWSSVPAEVDLPLHSQWEEELSRRIESISNGSDVTTPWSTIRQEALARI